MAVRDLRVGQVELSHCYLLTVPIFRFFVWESEVAVFNPFFLLFFRTLHRKGHLSSHHLVSKQTVEVQIDRFIVVDALDDLWDLVGLPTTKYCVCLLLLK